MNINDIQTGLRVATQIPLDIKRYSLNEASLQDLGVNDNLAYTYHKGLEVTCLEERTKYEWKEVEVGDIKLLASDFIYPSGLIVNDVDYSDKHYNFAKVVISPTIIPDATATVKGILKLTNDLGGTADLPTTPTSFHLTGNETVTAGIKQFFTGGTASGTNILKINKGTGHAETNAAMLIYASPTVRGAYMESDGASSALWVHSSGIQGIGDTALMVTNNAGGIGGQFSNNTLSTGVALSVQNGGAVNSKGLEVLNGYGRVAITVNQGNIGSGGDAFNLLDNGIVISRINKFGDITGKSFIKTGGTSSQYLMADGGVSELNPQRTEAASFALTDVDNGYTIFVNNGATAITISLGAITIPNFCVGFIQEGTADVTFTGVTNPIGLKSKGQGYQTFIERKLATSSYYLLGNTKA